LEALHAPFLAQRRQLEIFPTEVSIGVARTKEVSQRRVRIERATDRLRRTDTRNSSWTGELGSERGLARPKHGYLGDKALRFGTPA